MYNPRVQSTVSNPPSIAFSYNLKNGLFQDLDRNLFPYPTLLIYKTSRKSTNPVELIATEFAGIAYRWTFLQRLLDSEANFSGLKGPSVEPR